MSAWISFLIGFAVGGSVAAMMMACVQAGRRGEDRELPYQRPAAEGTVEQSTAEQDTTEQDAAEQDTMEQGALEQTKEEQAPE